MQEQAPNSAAEDAALADMPEGALSNDQLEELDALLTKAVASIEPDRLWANPDGGLKTRHYSQLEPSLRNLVAAARRIRRRAQ